MAQNQHYVPQFYLRNFSEDDKNINIINLGRLEYFNGPISKQCAKPNFYSENKEIETAFSKLEDKVAIVIKKIIDNKSFLINIQEYTELISFILWQSGRTNKAGQDTLKGINDIFDYLKPDLATMKEAKELGLTLDSFNKVKISFKKPALETSYRALSSTPLLFDMQLVILINESKVEFITSDSPTVLFNTYFNGKSKGGQTGYANKGLQIFLPIAPHCMVLLYDPNYYTIPFKENLTYVIKKNKDVRRLNGLQVVFGFNNIYFRNYKHSDIIQQFHDLRHEREEKTFIESLGTRPEGKGTAELIHFAKDNAIYDLSKLSFLIINPNADNIPGIRNLEVLKEHRKQLKKMFPKMEK